ncbi:hypothetical protein DFP72DRAFT_1123733 [Ephemerocybe angulata]|uniref:Uncharacterized protein n=1 Tax=Ephemerocybe angulata TaxID=980116 RepID=A0A8H6M543_9AGAR|nr:hypothetical protein DFP72DRAFT_1123733 [Tulosesus angulatus]
MSSENSKPKTKCDLCEGLFTPGGPLARHLKKCVEQEALQREQRELVGSETGTNDPPVVYEQPNNVWETQRSRRHAQDPYPIYDVTEPSTSDHIFRSGPSSEAHRRHPSPDGSPSISSSSSTRIEVNTIKTDFHPRAQQDVRVESLDEYQKRLQTQAAIGAFDTGAYEPWHPFRTRGDFKISEFVLRNTLSKEVAGELICLLNEVQSGTERVTLRNYGGLEDVWNEASHSLTPFEERTFSASLNGVTHTLTVQVRDVWSWALDLVKDPILAPHFEWDACKLSKFNGESWERFVNEPWTGEDFFEFQSDLPDDDGKPLCFILYSDKTQLSSFGKAKAWPVYARIANLPTKIRNGTGLGGGRIVGWLPVLEDADDPLNAAKPAFIDLKRVIWHKSWTYLLETLKMKAQNGEYIACGDGRVRRLYPRILILCADYEEQCIMAGIRGGHQASKPCPVCLIDAEYMGDYMPLCKRRTVDESRSAVSRAAAASTAKAREEILKPTGLRQLNNTFWDVADPYRALSWDRLHSYPGGLARHIYKEILSKYIDTPSVDDPRALREKVEQRVKDFPRWSGLIHFSHILTDIAFQDANKWEDMTRIALFVFYDLFPDDQGFRQLLRCLRCYLNLNAYSSFENYTEGQLKDIDKALKAFSEEIKKYAELNIESKIWNFPKLHTHMHMVADILGKGATRNFNTKPNEAMHRFLKLFYLFMSNFRDVDKQYVKFEHRCYITTNIRNLMDAVQAADKNDTPAPEADAMAGSSTQVGAESSLPRELHRQGDEEEELTSTNDRPSQNAIALENIEYLRMTAPTFDFQKALVTFLTQNSESILDVCPDFHIEPTSQTMIHDYQMLRVLYESKETWEWEENIVRCNPLFHQAARYDSVMIQTDTPTKPLFARLLHLFTIANSKDPKSPRIPLALILPYDGVVPQRQADKDAFLGLHRVRPKGSGIPEIVFARTILRGTLLIPAFSDATYIYASDHFVFDILDSDMFLRMKEISDSM